MALICALVLLLPATVHAQAPAKAKPSVLVLYWYNKDFLGNVIFEQYFKDALKNVPDGPVDYYAEYLEEDRFPGKEQAQLLHDHLRQKYANRKIDVVVAVSDPPLRFVLQHRADLFRHSPIVFLAIEPPANELVSRPPGMTGIVPASTHKETLDLALQLHADTEQLFFISGTPDHDKRLENIARTELRQYENKLKINYLTDLSIDELVVRARSLPPHSIILYGWQQSLGPHGEFIETWDYLSAFSPTASAPIYGMGSANIGRGIIGGYVSGSEENGRQMGEMVNRILSGEPAQNISIEKAPAEPMFDWRQLQRWHIDEKQLPPGSIVRFKEFTFWQRYRWQISVVITVLLVQSGFIALLLFERRQRHRAKKALDQLNAELETRIEARTAALNAKSRELETFAYAVAHDLKAPLRGIDGYSRLLLEEYATRLDHDGCAFLRTIRDSTDEMNQLIDDLLAYSRMERRELKPVRIELASVLDSLLTEKKREQAVRSIEFVVDVNGLAVLADPNGLTQSLRNYLDNAIKFTANVKNPRIEVGSTENEHSCVLWVKDNGIGFDMKYQDRIFEIFQRLNVSEEFPGTGVGLAIVRKAMERMGGKAWATSEPGQGATFYLELPNE